MRTKYYCVSRNTIVWALNSIAWAGIVCNDLPTLVDIVLIMLHPLSIHLAYLHGMAYFVENAFKIKCLAGPYICHHGCAYTVLQTVQMPGVCRAAYGNVHYKEPLKSFDKSRAY